VKRSAHLIKHLSVWGTLLNYIAQEETTRKEGGRGLKEKTPKCWGRQPRINASEVVASWGLIMGEGGGKSGKGGTRLETKSRERRPPATS